MVSDGRGVQTQPCRMAGPGMGSRPRIEYGAGCPRERRLCAQAEDGFPTARERRLCCTGRWPRLARLGGGAGSDPDFEPVGSGDAGLAHPVGGPLYPDALALGRSPGFAGAAALGAKSSSDRPGMRRGVLPDVLAVRVGHLAGDPVADFLVVVVLLVLAMEGGGHLVVRLDELVD